MVQMRLHIIVTLLLFCFAIHAEKQDVNLAIRGVIQEQPSLFTSIEKRQRASDNTKSSDDDTSDKSTDNSDTSLSSTDDSKKKPDGTSGDGTARKASSDTSKSNTRTGASDASSDDSVTGSSSTTSDGTRKTSSQTSSDSTRKASSDTSNDDNGNGSSDSSSDDSGNASNDSSSNTDNSQQSDDEKPSRTHREGSSRKDTTAAVSDSSLTQTDVDQGNSSIGPVNVQHVLDNLPECYKTCATAIAGSYMIGCSKLTELGCICPHPNFFNNTIKCVIDTGTKNCVALAQNPTALRNSQDAFISLCQSAGAPMDGTPAVSDSLNFSNSLHWANHLALLVLLAILSGALTLL